MAILSHIRKLKRPLLRGAVQARNRSLLARDWAQRHLREGRRQFDTFPKAAKCSIAVAFAVGLVGQWTLEGAARIPGLVAVWLKHAEVAELPAVTVAQAEMNEIADNFTVYATLQPLREAVLRPPSQVVVSAVSVKIGDRVRRGQTLAYFRSESQNLRTELEQIDLQRKEMDIELTMALSKKNFVSNREVRQSELDQRSAQIRRKLNEIEGSSRIISPIDGVVAELNLFQGDYIDQVQNFTIRVVQPNGIRVQAYVPGNVAARLQAGGEAEILPVSASGSTGATVGITATLNAVGTTLDPKTGSVFVDVTAAETPEGWRIGAIVELRLILEKNDSAITVPTQALVWKKGVPHVFKVAEPSRAPASEDDSSTVELVPVQLGIRGDNLTEIRQGIGEGVKVVTRGQGSLAAGAQVRVVE
jgi:RND family efflux transporter MFP subunit